MHKYRLIVFSFMLLASVSIFGQSEITPEHATTSEPCFWAEGGICFQYQTEERFDGGETEDPGTSLGCDTCDEAVEGQAFCSMSGSGRLLAGCEPITYCYSMPGAVTVCQSTCAGDPCYVA